MKITLNYAFKLPSASTASPVVTDSAVTLFDFGKINETNETKTTTNTKVEYPSEFYSILDLSGKMVNNVDLLCKLNAGSLVSIAQNASSNVFSIIQNIRNTIQSYSVEINSLLNNPFLSREEIENRIKIIQQKIKALTQEAQSKAMEMYMISEVVVSLAPTFAALQATGVNMSDITDMFKELLNNFDTTPSDLSDADNLSDINEIINNNKHEQLGKQSEAKLAKMIMQTEEKINENEEKLHDKSLSEDEIKKLNLENIVYNAALRVLKALK